MCMQGDNAFVHVLEFGVDGVTWTRCWSFDVIITIHYLVEHMQVIAQKGQI